ncbi:ABC transporter permease [Bacillus aquiflavi]|uniref:ABC transporter permease n=1 Tax=Bacillus aquiflavi TaxID=2672567 RepID=UPI001CA7C890|nr:ABC transporter permease [Bacillus aquiflavi]UAC49860.1 ABC transporter permease [Bacillus aquiflavi]
MNRLKTFFTQYRLFFLFFITTIFIWELAVQLEKVPSFIIPAPSAILLMIIEHKQSLFGEHLTATLKEVALGFMIALIGGSSLAVAMFFSKSIEKMLYPVVLISQTIPIIALSPVFVLWFGYTIWSKVAVTVLITFFPIVVSTYDGLKNSDPEYTELLKSMGASRWQLFTKIQIPMALPSFFSGLKLAIVFSVVGATIGEWLGASEGLGYYSRRMSGNLNAEGVFAAVTILSFLGMSFFLLVTILERRILKWKLEKKR